MAGYCCCAERFKQKAISTSAAGRRHSRGKVLKLLIQFPQKDVNKQHFVEGRRGEREREKEESDVEGEMVSGLSGRRNSNTSSLEDIYFNVNGVLGYEK